MKLEACLAGNRSSGSGIDSATKKQDSIFACHVRRLYWNTHVKMPSRNVTPFLALGNFCPFHWVTFLIPAHDALVENFHVAVTSLVKNAIGQTGQVMGTSSIQDDQSIFGYSFHIRIEVCKGSGNRAYDVDLAILFLTAHVDNQGFLPCLDILCQVIDGNELNVCGGRLLRELRIFRRIGVR